MTINDIMTLSEVEEVYNISRSTVKKAILYGRFSKNEYRQSGSTWLVDTRAVKRLWHYKISE